MTEANKYDAATQRDEYIAAFNRFIETNEKRQAERDVYTKRAELRTFNNLNGDTQRIVEAVKSQVLTFIYVSKALAGDPPTQQQRKERKKQIEQKKESLKKGIAQNEKNIKEHPNDEELLKNTQELREINPESIMQFHYDIIYSDEALQERINDAFSMYFDYLKKISPKSLIELQDYIADTIARREEIAMMQSGKKDLEALKSNIPQNYYIANNKLSNEITKDFLNNGNISLAVIKPNKKGEVCTYNSLTYEGKNIEISGRREFTAYDRAVHNAVCTLYEAGNENFTPQMVYRTLTGMTDTEKVSPQAIDEIMESLDKSRFTRLRVNFTAEAKARNMNIDKAEIDSYLLAAETITIVAGGREVTGFKILRKPVLYDYAQRTKQKSF